LDLARRLLLRFAAFRRFELGFLPDADFAAEAACITPLLRLSDVKGPLMSGGHGGCNLRRQLGGGVRHLRYVHRRGPATGSCVGDDGSPVAEDAAIDVRTDDGGIGPVPPVVSPGGGDGCGCHAGGSARMPGIVATWLAAALAMWRRRARRVG
jgi:hypothetical protein